MSPTYGFFLPTRVEYGSGIMKKTAELLDGLSADKPDKRVFLVTDRGLIKAGLIDPIADSLDKYGYAVKIFDDVKPNPRDVDCEAGGAAIRDFEADIILAIGGGSVMDAAKSIAALHTHEGKISRYVGRGKLERGATPLVAVPTTAGTGSEVTRSSVITDTERGIKVTVNDIRLVPKLAIIDPELTYALPKPLTASTGMDALVHAIEAFTCKAATPFSDAWAKEAMRLIYANLKDAVHQGSRDARNGMMLGSMMAGVAFSNSDVAAVHCLAEALGGLYDAPHGVANSIFLPLVTEFNSHANPARHAEAARICGMPVSGMTDAQASEFLVNELEELSKDIGIPLLSELPGVHPSDFERLAEASCNNGSTPNNCREITATDYLDLLTRAYEKNGR